MPRPLHPLQSLQQAMHSPSSMLQMPPGPPPLQAPDWAAACAATRPCSSRRRVLLPAAMSLHARCAGSPMWMLASGRSAFVHLPHLPWVELAPTHACPIAGGCRWGLCGQVWALQVSEPACLCTAGLCIPSLLPAAVTCADTCAPRLVCCVCALRAAGALTKLMSDPPRALLPLLSTSQGRRTHLPCIRQPRQQPARARGQRARHRQPRRQRPSRRRLQVQRCQRARRQAEGA